MGSWKCVRDGSGQYRSGQDRTRGRLSDLRLGFPEWDVVTLETRLISQRTSTRTVKRVSGVIRELFA